MTEQKELYQDGKLIGYCSSIITSFDRYTITDFEAIKEISEPVHLFKVGEYYKKDSSFGHVYKVIENSMTEMQSVIFYDCVADAFKEFILHEKAIAHDPDATAEEIALFKRAEHFHKHGRKLNEFKHSDVVWIDEEYQVVFDMGNRLYLYNICGEVIGEQDTVSLIMTAEELEAAATEVKG